AHHAALLVKGEVLTSTCAHFQHDPVCLATRLTPQGIEPSSDQGLIHHPVVKSGKTRVGDLLHAWRMTQLVAHRLAPLPFEVVERPRRQGAPYAFTCLLAFLRASWQSIDIRRGCAG